MNPSPSTPQRRHAMRRVLRVLGLAGAGLVICAAIAAATIGALSERKLQRQVEVEVAAVPYAEGDAALTHGAYLYRSRGCLECHGAEGGGDVVVDEPNGLYVRAPNITAGGVTAGYSEQDWVRSIRHGIDPSARPLLFMPSEEYNRLTDADLAALVAYVRSLPPTAGSNAKIHLPWLLKALYVFGVFPDAAEKIDHRRPPSQPVPVAVSAEHGAYLAMLCTGCHGAALTGGKIPGAPPDWPPAADLSPGAGSAMRQYGEVEEFKTMMRTGKRPDGSAVSEVMPFASLAELNDTDLEALHLYLHTLPAQAASAR